MSSDHFESTVPTNIAGTAGPRAIEAFSVLGNELRLSILLALWEAFEPFAEETALPFSELRERVGVRDSGNFNYHLDKVVGQFVRRTDAGYELRRPGHQLVRLVIAGTGIEEPSFDPSETDNGCGRCGAPTTVTGEDGWLYRVCTECDGYFGRGDDRPEGILSGRPFEPAGFTNRRPTEAWDTKWITMNQSLQSGIEGVCDACSGPMDRSLDVCEDHASDGVCDNCGRRWALAARLRCPVCKNHHLAPPRTIVAQHPAVVAFYYERGVSIQYEVDDYERRRRVGTLVSEHEQELVSDEPPRVRVTVQYEGDTLALTLDEDLDVVDVTESG